MRYPKFDKCILCRTPDLDLTDEHIFPEATGGKLSPKILCKSCNSKLGRKVDSPYANQKIVELARTTYHVKGKNGHIPQPFSTVHSIKTPDANIEIKMNSKFHPIVQPRAPQVSITEEGGVMISFSRDVSEKENIPKIVRATLTRFFRSNQGKTLNWSEDHKKKAIHDAVETSKSANTKTHTIENMLHETWKIDLKKIFAEQAKVIYEICALEFGECFMSTKQAEKIRRYLLNIIDSEIQQEVESLEQLTNYLSIAPVIAPQALQIVDLFTNGEPQKFHIAIVTGSGVICSMLGMGASFRLDDSVADHSSYIGRVYRCDISNGTCGVYELPELIVK